MTLSSRMENGKRIYSFDLTEEEYKKAQDGEPINRLVEWMRGRGVWVIHFTNLIGQARAAGGQ